MNAPVQHPVVAADTEHREGPLVIDATRYRRMAATDIFSGLGKIELRSGVVYQTNSQAVPHMRVKMRLARLLETAIADAGVALEVAIEGSVQLSDYEVPDPDICLWDGSVDDGFIPGSSVRLVVEVADSTIAGDLGRKARLYALHGIAEYWVADVQARVVHRMSGPGSDGYLERTLVRCGERLESVTIPGLALDLPQF